MDHFAAIGSILTALGAFFLMLFGVRRYNSVQVEKAHQAFLQKAEKRKAALEKELADIEKRAESKRAQAKASITKEIEVYKESKASAADIKKAVARLKQWDKNSLNSDS